MRFVRLVLVLVLAAAMPMKGFAAARMLFCGAPVDAAMLVHQSSASADQGAHGHHGTAKHADHGAPSHGFASHDAAHAGGDAGSAGGAVESACSVCAVCSTGGLALVAAWPSRADFLSRHAPVPHADRHPAEFVPPTLDRPPLAG